MKKKLLLGLVSVAAIALVVYGQTASSGRKQPSNAATSLVDSREVLNQYCVYCHNNRMRSGGLALDTLDPAHVDERPETWEKVVRKLRAGMMPPSGDFAAGHRHLRIIDSRIGKRA